MEPVRATAAVTLPGDSMGMRPLEDEDLGPDRSLLILDDDESFLRRLSRAMEKRGFER